MKKQKLLKGLLLTNLIMSPSFVIAAPTQEKPFVEEEEQKCDPCVKKSIESYEACEHWCGYNDFHCLSNCGSALVGHVKACEKSK